LPAEPDDRTIAPEGALAPFRIAELGSGFGSAYAAKLLADLGADVIKIEPLGGDPMRQRGPTLPGSNTSELFSYLTTSKRSITLAHDSSRGRRLIETLCRKCDALIVDVDSLHQLAPEFDLTALTDPASGLIVVSLSALPRPFAYAKGSELGAQALAGLCSQMGEPGRHPLFWPYGQGGYQAGLVGCIALLGLLFGRSNSVPSEPASIDVSILRVLGSLIQGHGSFVYRYGGHIPSRHGARAVTRPYPTGLFAAHDGLVAIHCSDDVMWDRLGEMMGNPQWMKDPAFDDRLRVAEHSPEVGDRHLLPYLRTRRREDLFADALERRLSLAPVFTNSEIAESEQLEQRDFWRMVDHGSGRSVRVPGAPYRLSRTPSVAGSSPELGEHTLRLLESLLGQNQDEIQRLREAGLV
jgi:crotonobetainyl-CoA:carnitine CoA-transferase CaiB-like acyl-CoA transferase